MALQPQQVRQLEGMLQVTGLVGPLHALAARTRGVGAGTLWVGKALVDRRLTGTTLARGNRHMLLS